jgi:thiol:disulfide interchange protein DsbD
MTLKPWRQLLMAAVWLLLALGCGLGAPASAEGGPPAYATAKLMADTTAIVPGKSFQLGVYLEPQPGWHTYYKESGEAGMPTRITWTLPSGFKASDLEWEKPSKFNDSGIVTYGYDHAVLIGAKIDAPANLTEGSTVKLQAQVKWLTCKDMCVPGKANVELSMKVAKTAAPANTQLFSKLGFTAPVSTLKEDHAQVPGAGTTGSSGPTGTSGSTGSTSATGSSGPSGTSGSTGSTSATGSSGSTGTSGSTGSTSATGSSGSTGTSGSAGRNILDENIQVQGQEKMGLPAYLALAFIGGFILNFMPCVLPVISIKVLSFMQQAGEDPKRIFQLGLTFTAGIVSSFMLLAVLVIVLQQAGSKVGWGVQFQYPIFLLAMSTVVLLFALSLFGLFYIQVSAGQNQIDKLASGEGFTGTFFKGVLATTLSTPCTAPFLGTALGFAFAEPAWVILLIFFFVAAGMSFPYVLLTARPAWMRYLPKPGVWMEKFKESMGFLLLATVVWLVWVLGQQVGFNATIAAVAFLVAVSFAVWLVGRFVDLTASDKRKAVVYSLAGLVLAAAYFILLRPFPELLSLSPPHAEVSTTGSASNAAGGLTWVPFTIDGLNKQLDQGKTVFIDFTADWCLTCKVNENTVINTAPVIGKLKELKVVTMRADWTRQDPEISKLLAKFGRSGVPLYVIIPASDKATPASPIILPEVITQSIVLDDLVKAGASKT